MTLHRPTTRHSWPRLLWRGAAVGLLLTLCCGRATAQHVATPEPEVRTYHTPYFAHHGNTLDDMTRWTPTMLRLGLRIAGVEGRSGIGRLVAGRLTGWGLNIGVTEGLKRSVHRTRPDGWNRKSMPSGHAAVAFMSAAVLHEEYGYLHPLVTVGGYALSTEVGYRRVAAHHHYPSDVLLGAAIGVLAAKAGYYIGDLMVGHRGRHMFPSDFEQTSWSDCSATFGFEGGMSVPLGNYGNADGARLRLCPGLQAAFTATFHAAGGLGWTARVGETHYQLSRNGSDVAAWVERLTLLSGPRFTKTVGQRCQLSASLAGGYAVQVSGRSSTRREGAHTAEGAAIETAVSGNFMMGKQLALSTTVAYEALAGRRTDHFLNIGAGLHWAF